MKLRNASNLQAATRRGEQVAQEEGFTSLPINPFEIASKHEIEVQEKADSGKGISGALVRRGNTFGILYATHVKSPGFQRFSVAHELGHYFLEGHPDKIFNGDGLHESYAGFASSDECELEADHFASGLLMPSFLFKDAIAKSKDGLEGIKAIADKCDTSLTATAIRYVQYTDCSAAIVMSSGKFVDYCFMSDSLKAWNKELEWIAKGSLVPDSVLTHEFNSDPDNVQKGISKSSSIDIVDWFGGLISGAGIEEVIGLGNYGKTLTVLSFPNLPDEEELEEEERLTDSLTPRFRR